MTKQPSSMKYYCAPCDSRGPTREWLTAHKAGWSHKATVTKAAFASKGWVGTRTMKSVFEEAHVPFKVAEYIDPDEPLRLDKFGRGDFVAYVPAAVADAIKEWSTLPSATRRSTPLAEYLKTMFAQVDWEQHHLDEVHRAARIQEAK